MNKITPGSNMIWESSRFMMPEHIHALKMHEYEKNKVEKPGLDEQELEEIGIVVMDSLRHELEVAIVYWEDGFFHNVVGSVDFVDMQQKRIRVRVEGEKLYISIDCLKSVERV